MKLIRSSGFAEVRVETGLVKLWRAPVVVLLVAALFALLGTRTEPAHAHHLCPNTGSPLGAFPFDTYEDANYRTTYAHTFELAGLNQLFPELPSFALPQMETGPRAAGSSQLRSPYIPPALLKAIAWIEAGWAQADYSVPYGAVGPVLASHDCGYGAMQVTTGMQNISGVPNVDQAMIGGHYAFNIARGARILVDKWNYMPEYRPLVGSRDPALIEDWYFAVWAYNGFAFKNHPLNPSFNPARPSYSCGPLNDGLGHDRTQYPYQELVFGCMAHPPVIGGVPLWTPQEVHLPERSNPVFAGPLSTANWDACAYSLQCAAMDIPTPNPNHRDATVLGFTRAQVIGSPSLGLSAGGISMTSVPPSLGATSSLTVSNAGTGVLSYRVISNASWLRISRYQGVALGADLGGSTSTVQITADTSGMAPGRYTAQLTIDSPLTVGAPRVVPVVVDNYLDGSLLRGSGPDVYVVQGGLRRHAVSLENFLARGYSFSAVRDISDELLNTVPLGLPQLDLFAAGALIKGSAPDVYVMQDGVRRHAVSAERFVACGYRWDAIVSVPDAVISLLRTGDALQPGECPRLSFANGTLLEESDTGVWVIEDGKRRWAVSPDMFVSCGYQWGNINTVADGLIASIPQGPPLNGCYPDGSLIRGSEPDVYVVRGGLRRHVVSLPNFLAQGYSLSNVQILPDNYLSTVPLGLPQLDLFATGALIKGSAPDVYVMEDGFKRHTVSAERFLGCGYKFDAIVSVPDAAISLLPTGDALQSGECPRRTFSDGTLLEGPTPGIWVVKNGERRWAVSPDMFLSCGFEWGNVNTVSDGILTSIPQGPPLNGCYPDGSLIRGSEPDVYVVRGGLRRHVVSLPNFLAWGYSLPNVQILPDNYLSTVPLGRPLLDLFATGALIKGSAPDVYVMEHGFKRHTVSAERFLGCGYKFDAVVNMPDSIMPSVPTGSPLGQTDCPRRTFSDGTLLEGPTPGIWVIQGGKRRWAVSPEVFVSCGYQWGDVDHVADSTIIDIPVGLPLSRCQ